MHKGLYKIFSFFLLRVDSSLSIAELVQNSQNSAHGLFIGRMGSTEAKAVVLSKKIFPRFLLKKVMGFKNNRYVNLHRFSGMWSNDENSVRKFGEMYFQAAKSVDYLATWRVEDVFITGNKFPLHKLEPYFMDVPWTLSLIDKRILIVHPFKASIEKQLNSDINSIHNRRYFSKTVSFQVYKAFQGYDYFSNEHTWFEVLNNMVEEICEINPDVVFVAAGAFGLPLASRLNNGKRIIFHMGGSLQLLFGIKGKRWENDMRFRDVITERFISPLPEDIPNNFKKVEEGCYW